MVNKKKFKIVSIITTVFVITTLISLKGLITKADVASRPEFDIEFDKIRDEALVGEDILVTGKIKPKPFEVNVTNINTKIVMVIDKNTDNNQGQGEVLNPLVSDISNTIKKLSLTGNIKLGFIDYLADANIYKYNNNALVNIDNKDIIAKAIGNLKSEENEYSNTGEALRRAAYLMESSESNGVENKIIVLFSDGVPTARTVYSNEDAYTNITEEDHNNAQIKTSKDNYSNDIKYAKTIGNIIKENGYTVYTVGYNIKFNENQQSVLREIHKSMTGYNWDNKEEDIKNKFYILEDKKFTVEEVFNLIKKDILETYPVNNVKMNLNFTGDFSLNIGGNTVNLNNINYKLVSQSNDGKARYEADSIPFEFVVKGNKEGYQQMFDKVTINYPWQDSIKNVDINNELFITIKPNQLPSIVPKLISNDKIEIKKDGEIFLKYEITPEDFIYNNVSNSGESDVLFLIDSSKKNYDTTKNILEKIHAEILQKLDSKTKYSAITFNSTADILFDFNYIGDKDSGDYANSINQRKFKNITYSGEERNIGEAFKLVEEVFKTGRATASKNIVIISNDDVKYTDSDYNKIKGKNYNIITISYQYKNIESSLYEVHKLIEGKEDNIIFPTSNLNDAWNYSPGYAREKLKSFSLIKPYLFNPIINLNLGNNFNPEFGIIKSSESGKENIGVVEVPIITYNLTQNNNYHASSQIIEIKIKANNLSTGTYTFGNITDNTISYKNLLNKDVSMAIKTPIIIVKDEIKDVSYGLYNGISDGQVSIQETNNGDPFEIAQGSTATFGAKFTLSGSTDFKLNVDKNIQGVDENNIKIYQILNGALEEVKIEDKKISGENNEFNISINVGSNTEILVVYQGKIIDGTASGQTLTNDIVFSSTSKKATIVTSQQSTYSPILPDLF